MEKMSKAQESRLIKGVEQIIDKVSKGSEPCDACVKVASDLNFNKEMTKRAIEAYNQSKTLHELSNRKGSDRLGSFPIIKTAEVMDKLFPERVVNPITKQASAQIVSSVKSVTTNFNKVAQVENRLETHGHLVKGEALEKSAESITKEKIKTLNSKNTAVTKQIQATKLAYDTTQIKFEQLSSELHDCIRNAVMREPFHRIESFIHSKFGKEAQAISDFVYNLSGVEKLGHRRAAPHELISSDFTLADWAPIGASIENVVKIAQELQKKAIERTKLEKVAQELDSEKKALFDMTGNALGYAKSKLDEFKSPDSKSVFNTELDKAVTGLNDPSFRDDMERIKTQAVLHDLMTNDDVISTYEPHKVTGLFNELHEVAPMAASKPAVLRDLLRRGLVNGGFESLEIGQLGDINKRLSESNYKDIKGLNEQLLSDPATIRNKALEQSQKSKGNAGVGGAPKNLFSVFQTKKDN